MDAKDIRIIDEVKEFGRHVFVRKVD